MLQNQETREIPPLVRGQCHVHARLEDIAGKAEKSALAYFEDVAEGKRFDEKLIREAADATRV